MVFDRGEEYDGDGTGAVLGGSGAGRVTGILRYSGNPAREICLLIEGHKMRNKPCRTKTM